MIDHIKLAEECDFYISDIMTDRFAESLKSYTNAILERAAVKCDELSYDGSIQDECDSERGARYCAEAIRQEKV